MRKRRYIIELELLEDWVSFEDFEQGLDLFNNSNKGVMQVNVKEKTDIG